MNKKILGIALTVFFLTMMVAPAMAKGPKKIPVTMEMSGAYYNPPPTEAVWTSGNTKHGRGFTGGWEQWDIMIEEELFLAGSLETTYGSYNVNLKNGHGMIMRKMIITFDGGTFEGNNIQNGIIQMMGPTQAFPRLVDGTVHAVFHGTGDYLGWTIVVTVEQPGAIREAYLLIP